MTTKTTNTIEIDGEVYDTEPVVYKGTRYVLRELGVDEDDNLAEASTDKDGKFNGRLHLRMSLAAAIIEPKTSIDDIGKWPGKKYVALSRAFNRLNTIPEDSSGKDSASDTSGEPT